MLENTVKTNDKGRGESLQQKSEGNCSAPQRSVADLVILSTFLYS